MILSKEEKATMLAEFIKEIKEMHNIEVELPTVSGISPRVSNGSDMYCWLRYSTEMGFNIGTSGMWISHIDAHRYAMKLNSLADIVNKLNVLYKPL